MIAIQPFVFPGLRSRVVFSPGALSQATEEIGRLGRRKAFVLSTPAQADDARALAGRLGALAAGLFTEAAMHTPLDVTERALEAFGSSGADCVVSFGGGSTIGLGKAIALRTGADQIAIPTTYAGSEMTDILGETAGGEKTTRRDPAILPETVIYDVDLTLGLPVAMSVTSGLNAMAHAAEALYAPDRNPVTSLMAVEGLRALKEALPRIVADPRDLEARGAALYGAWMCGTVLGAVAMSLHHKLCHTLGGSFGTPHADTHAIMLPHTVAFNEVAVPDLLAPAAHHFGGRLGRGLWDFASEIGAPLRLADLGLSEVDLDRAAEIATRNPYQNPRAFDRDAIRQLLQNAYEGARPEH